MGFGDSSVTIGEAFRIANKALKKLENIPEAKNAALEHWNLSEGDDLYEFRHENFDKEDMNEWASDINSLARKIKAYAPSQSSELTRAATLMNSGIASNPMVYRAYLQVPPESPEYEATSRTLGNVLQSIDVRNLPGQAVVVNLDDGNKVFIVANKNQIRVTGKEPVSNETNALRVVRAYLESAAAVSEERKSKVDKATQTAAVEKLLKETVTSLLPTYNGKVYAVGGFVRDSILGSPPKDIDLVVDEPKDDMDAAGNFAKRMAAKLGITSPNNPALLSDKFGIWGLVLANPKADGRPFTYDGVDISGYQLEIAPPRKEGPYGEKREPESAEYTTLEEDAKRRDLTINSIFEDVATGKRLDFVGGTDDIKRKILRPSPHPKGLQQIYFDDPLRIFRAIRFEGKLPGFKITPDTDKAIKEFANSPEGRERMKVVSKERIKDELRQILTHPDGNVAADGLDLMRDIGILDYVSPSLAKLVGVSHDTRYGHYGESAWDHTLDVLRKTPPSEIARLAALFHDIGKPLAYKEVEKKGETKRMFPSHAELGVDLVRKALADLKFESNVIDRVTNIVHGHMAFSAGAGGEKAERKDLVRTMRVFIQALYEDLDDAMAVIKADQAKHPESLARVTQLEQELRRMKEDDVKKGILAPTQKGFRYIDPMSGDELMEEYSELKEVSDGRVIGDVKQQLKRILMEGGMDDPGPSIKEHARKAMQGIANKQGWEKQLLQKVRAAGEKAKQKKKKEREEGKPPRAAPFESQITLK